MARRRHADHPSLLERPPGRFGASWTVDSPSCFFAPDEHRFFRPLGERECSWFLGGVAGFARELLTTVFGRVCNLLGAVNHLFLGS